MDEVKPEKGIQPEVTSPAVVVRPPLEPTAEHPLVDPVQSQVSAGSVDTGAVRASSPGIGQHSPHSGTSHYTGYLPQLHNENSISPANPQATPQNGQHGNLPQITFGPQTESHTNNTGSGHNPGPVDSESGIVVQGHDQVRQMETRLVVAEQSNRALLDEVLRLQGQLQSAVRASQDALAAERKSRDQLEAVLISIKESVAQLSSRLERAEGTTQLDRSSLAAVVNQAKALEQTLIQTHGELKGNQSQQSAQLQEMRAELNEMNATHNRMESLVYNLADDLRELRAAANMQFMQFQTTTAELKQKTDKISHDNKKVAEKIRAHQDTAAQSEVNTANLRIQVEARLSELSRALLDLNAKVENSIQKQNLLEQTVVDRLGDVQATLKEQHGRVEDTEDYIKSHLNKERGSVEADRLALRSEVQRLQEHTSGQLQEVEQKLQEGLDKRMDLLEKEVGNHMGQLQVVEAQFQRVLKDHENDVETRMEEDIAALRTEYQEGHQRHHTMLAKINEGLNLLEEQFCESRRQLERVVAAEIKERQQRDVWSRQQLEGVQERLRLSVATLQSSIGTLASDVAETKKKQHEAMMDIVANQSTSVGHTLVDLDSRVENLTMRLQESESVLQNRISGLSSASSMSEVADLLSNLNARVASLTQWQDVTQQAITSFRERMAIISGDMSDLQSKLTNAQVDVNNRLSGEALQRAEDFSRFQASLEQVQMVANSSVSEQKAARDTMKKIAGSLHNFKNIINNKLQTETTQRAECVSALEDDIKALEEELSKIKAQYDEQFETPRLSAHGVGSGYSVLGSFAASTRDPTSLRDDGGVGGDKGQQQQPPPPPPKPRKSSASPKRKEERKEREAREGKGGKSSSSNGTSSDEKPSGDPGKKTSPIPTSAKTLPSSTPKSLPEKPSAKTLPLPTSGEEKASKKTPTPPPSSSEPGSKKAPPPVAKKPVKKMPSGDDKSALPPAVTAAESQQQPQQQTQQQQQQGATGVEKEEEEEEKEAVAKEVAGDASEKAGSKVADVPTEAKPGGGLLQSEKDDTKEQF